MKIVHFEDEESWREGRRTKITGTRLDKIVVLRGNAKKKGYYELIAERLALPPDGENPMEHGHKYESVALERFEEETGKVVNKDLVIWMRDDNENIAVSPDGFIQNEPGQPITEAVEAKCFNSENHIEAYLTQDYPKTNASYNGYHMQKLQYFIVNKDLQKLYVVFYDPRMPTKDFFYLTFNREDLQEEISLYLEYERKILEEVEEIVTKLSF